MLIDSVESGGLNVEKFEIESHLKNLNKEVGTITKPIDGYYQRIDSSIDKKFSKMLGIDDVSVITSLHPTIIEMTKDMLQGKECGGFKTTGLEKLATYRLDKNSDYYLTNLKQQSGFAAEIVSTYKENLTARAKGSEITTYRTDDLPILFQEKKFRLKNGEEWIPKKNDQFIDKVRMNSKGEIIERIQTKFVGKNGDEWIKKMMSPKFEKYLEGNHVDKLECPKEFFKDIKNSIPSKIGDLEKQLERVKKEGKSKDILNGIQHKIDKLNKINEMVEQSNTTTREAIVARLNPQKYTTKKFTTELTKISNKEGLKGGLLAAGLTFTVSTVDNISSYLDGEISAEEMVTDIVTETAASGLLGYGTDFISTAVSQTMKVSSKQLLRNVGGSCLPATAISFAVESYDSISEFAQGKIDGEELAFELGDNASSIAGGLAGAKVGMTVGSLAGPAGTIVGSVVGGMVGCVVASETYATAIETGVEGAKVLADKAEALAQNTVDTVKEVIPEKVKDVADAFNKFIDSNKLPIKLHF